MVNVLHWAVKGTNNLGLTLSGGGRGHLCSSILKPCEEGVGKKMHKIYKQFNI